eukprot:1139485-Pelagomonas_calceolata.AAC.7
MGAHAELTLNALTRRRHQSTRMTARLSVPAQRQELTLRLHRSALACPQCCLCAWLCWLAWPPCTHGESWSVPTRGGPMSVPRWGAGGAAMRVSVCVRACGWVWCGVVRDVGMCACVRAWAGVCEWVWMGEAGRVCECKRAHGFFLKRAPVLTGEAPGPD